MNSDCKFLIAETAACINRLEVFPTSHLLVAVSGGLDSMVLLHRLGQLPANVRPQLTVAHLNHGLRKSESDADQRLVLSLIHI